MSTSATTAAPAATSTFNGQSQFASSLQQVITRAVGIASLPLDSDQAALTTLNAQQTALQGLDTDFTSLQSSVTSLQTALTSSSLTGSVSDGTVAATLGDGATAGTYSIQVDDLGAYSTALSNAGATTVTDPTSQGISSSATLTLNVNGTLTTITPASTSLDDLASAINSQAAGQAQATVVNIGSTSSPDYRLSLTAANLGTLSIDLDDSSGNSVIQESNLGSLASYEVGGLSTPVSSDSRTVTLAPGLTVNLVSQNTSGVPTTITVSNDPTALGTAFTSLAQAYNQAATDLAKYHGANGGALEGDSVISTLTNVLQQLSNYSNGTPESALANFGITVDDTGQLSVDTTAFTTAATANFSTLASTLGGTTTGGFLQAATNALNSVEDTTAGSLKIEENNVASEIAAQNTTIAGEQAKITLLQTNLTAQMVTADAAISALESQLSYVNGLFYSITGNNNNPNATSSIA
jgi:flagellar hook-associated protein 2